MLYHLKMRKLFIACIIIAAVIFVLFYTRERKLMISSNTIITMDFNGMNIQLSSEEEAELKDILGSARMRRSLNRIAGPYLNDGTVFIKIQDAGENVKISGVLTVCLYDIKRSNFKGNEPKGMYRVNREDMQKIEDFLRSVIRSLDIEKNP